MTRTDQDTWDLASSVGATATMVAAARALASAEPHPIINDPFAAPLVRAVGLDFFIRLVDGEVTASKAHDQANQAHRDLQLETDSIAVRTRFFDDFFLNAARDGVRQAVILAAGLDARPYRLSWPGGSVVYEVDQPKVIEFKSAMMASLGAAPAADRRTVGIDLRDDWPAALRGSGFDDTQPTAWSAEGLLMYLPPDAQDRLFDSITTLSAPGSRIATEYHGDDGGPDDGRTRGAVQPAMGQNRLRHRPIGALLRRRAQQRRRLLAGSRLAGEHPPEAGSVRRLRPHLPRRRRLPVAHHRQPHRYALIAADDRQQAI